MAGGLRRRGRARAGGRAGEEGLARGHRRAAAGGRGEGARAVDERRRAVRVVGRRLEVGAARVAARQAAETQARGRGAARRWLVGVVAALELGERSERARCEPVEVLVLVLLERVVRDLS